MTKKRSKKTIAATVASVLTFGAFGGYVQGTNAVTGISNGVSNHITYNYLNGLEQEFFSWKIVNENPHLEQYYRQITSTKVSELNKDEIKNFVETRKQLLQLLYSTLHTQYSKGTPEYNEVLQRVIPQTKHYLQLELELLPDSLHSQILEYKNEVITTI